MDQSMDVPPHPIIGKGKNGRFFSETSDNDNQIQILQFQRLMKSFKKKSHPKRKVEDFLGGATPMLESAIGANGMGSFFRHVGR